MTATDVVQQLDATPRESWAAIDKLALQLRGQFRDGPDMLARFWNARIGSERAKYERIISGLEEVAAPTWLAAADAARDDDRLDALRGAAPPAAAWRTQVVLRLLPMLERKTAITPPARDELIEEKDLPSRDCDEVYLAVRQLLRPDDSEYVSIVVRRRFLRLTEQERDAEIQSFRDSRQFAAIYEAQS